MKIRQTSKKIKMKMIEFLNFVLIKLSLRKQMRFDFE